MTWMCIIIPLQCDDDETMTARFVVVVAFVGITTFCSKLQNEHDHTIAVTHDSMILISKVLSIRSSLYKLDLIKAISKKVSEAEVVDREILSQAETGSSIGPERKHR
jgi:hypothetical protein